MDDTILQAHDIHVTRQARTGLEVVREAQGEGKCASDLVDGHLPNEEVEARYKRLYSTAQKVVKRARTAQYRAGGKTAVPDQALHPLARPERPRGQKAASFDWIGSKGRIRAQGPCWRPSCPTPDECNAGTLCKVYKDLARQHEEGTEAFFRAMLAEGPFHPMSRFAALNAVSARYGRSIPDEYPLPAVPERTRRVKHTCKRPDCPFKGTDRACRGGRECERQVQILRGAKSLSWQKTTLGRFRTTCCTAKQHRVRPSCFPWKSGWTQHSHAFAALDEGV
eukprot:s3703_g1.t1